MDDLLEHGQRRFRVMAYDDAIHDDAWAVELAELVDGELGPSIVTVLFPSDETPREPRVLVSQGDLPLPVLQTFLAVVDRESRRIQQPPPLH
ncbi:hypothetical protein OG203_01940 [Nocardia sp. NBC_01499]|uniref:hypothetical protein n=1 Tax=Nocardia sp. NBC_01499 TaxID=2903597 RepID=UPI003866D552